jgi:hypothetical protein
MSSSNLIEPIGMGTGLVEASSSIWKRAAERLSVHWSDLLRWGFDEWHPPMTYPLQTTARAIFTRRFRGFDGANSIAQVYILPLKRLLPSARLEACTLLPFTGLLSGVHLLRRYRAWCPMCFASMALGREMYDNEVYEPLLWRLEIVTVCPLHQIRLLECCDACRAPRQAIFSRFSRIGCCNLCGAWLGRKEVDCKPESPEGYEVRVAHAMMDLLARTSDFERQGHDGRSTMGKLAKLGAVRDVLVSKCGVAHATVDYYSRNIIFPPLSILVAIAVVSQQPLYQVILGQIVPWLDEDGQISKIFAVRGRARRNWEAIGNQFKQIADDPSCMNLEDACKKLNLHTASAYRHYPDLVSKIVCRGREFRSRMAEERQCRMLDQARSTFRSLMEDGVYPSISRIFKVSGIHDMSIDKARFDAMIDEEWKRAERETDWRRKSSKNPNFVRRL